MSVDEFHQQAFPAQTPLQKKLWLDAEQKRIAAKILHKPFPALRVGYWYNGERTAWILEEVGKELPITMGVVIENDSIVDFSVLEFRESRGGEIRYPFYTKQFQGLRLAQAVSHEREQAPSLNGDVDGITGATLSVRATKKIATLALFFHQLVTTQHNHGGVESDSKQAAP